MRKQLKYEDTYRRIFGVGPVGVLITVVIWLVLYFVEQLFGIPQASISPFFRSVLLIYFATDALYLLIGANYQLRKSERGKELVTKGPYQFIRHPIYSVWIYSFTAMLALWRLSWGLIISVLPLTLLWSWLVQHEEREMYTKYGDKYQKYAEMTGQFLPSFKGLKEAAEREV